MAAGWYSGVFRWLLGRWGAGAAVPVVVPDSTTCLTGTGSLTTGLTGAGSLTTGLTGAGSLTVPLTGTGGDCH